jgi:hypothetical protein
LGGIPEMIEENKTGWLFTPGDSNGLGVKLRLIHDQDLVVLKLLVVAKQPPPTLVP